MLTFALVVFIVMPACGAVVLGVVMWFDRSTEGAQQVAALPAAALQPAARAQVDREQAAGAAPLVPQQGLVAGMVARVTSPGIPRAAAAWAERTFSGSHPRVAAPR